MAMISSLPFTPLPSPSPPLLRHRLNLTPPLPPSPSLFLPPSTTITSSSSLSPNRRGAIQVLRAAYGSSGDGVAAVEFGEGLSRALDGVEVFDVSGRAVPILDLWRDRKAVVGFARHFGCILCRKRADLLASKKDMMDKVGVALVLIGPGSTDQAKAFLEKTKFIGEVYADPLHSSFKALNFVSGFATVVTPTTGLKLVESYVEGYRQDWGLSFQKETMSKGGWQQGGILVAGPGTGNISYFHKDKEAGDDPDIEEVIKACCTVA